jgi:hypothetical protein
MSRELPPSIVELFRHLAAVRGARVRPPEYSGSFDQVVEEADVGDLRIRFVRDRGSASLEVGWRAEWFGPDLLRFVLLGHEPDDVPSDLIGDAAFLREHFDDIQRLFSPSARNKTLRQLAEARVNKMRRMFPDPSPTRKPADRRSRL